MFFWNHTYVFVNINFVFLPAASVIAKLTAFHSNNAMFMNTNLIELRVGEANT